MEIGVIIKLSSYFYINGETALWILACDIYNALAVL